MKYSINAQELAPNQLIIVEGNKRHLKSYRSRVVSINVETKELMLYDDWDYSMTTKKYVKKFIYLFLGKSYDTKELTAIYDSQE